VLPREEGAADHHKQSVDQTMERLGDIGQEVSRWGDPVGKPADGDAGALDLLPVADIAYPPAPFEAFEQDLGEEVEVADEGGLEDDRDVGGVEQLDREGGRNPSVLLVHQLHLHLEPLQVDHQEEHEHSCEEVGQVGRGVPIEGLVDGRPFVRLGQQQMDQGDDRPFELSPVLRLDGDGTERSPDDVFRDVYSNKERDT